MGARSVGPTLAVCLYRVASFWPGGLLLARDGKSGRLPSREASLDVEDLLVARREQSRLTLPRARPDHAIEGDTVGCVNLSDALRHLVERDVHSTRDVA